MFEAKQEVVSGGGAARTVQSSLQDAEREVLLGMIAQHRWNMSQVARNSHQPQHLYRKIKRHGIVIARRPAAADAQPKT